MRILMTRPKPSPETIGLQHLMLVEPLELEILAALKRPHDEVLIVDMIIENATIESFLLDFKPDIFCITGYITNVSSVKEYCEKAKSILPKIFTIVGGVHCEVCPEDFSHHSIDFRVVRNACRVFTPLLNHIENQTEVPKGVLSKGETLNVDQLPEFDFYTPMPQRDLVSKYRNKYFYIFHDKVALLKTSFGCPYTCSFCFCRIITEGKYFQRDIEDIMTELSSINEEEIYIVDDDFLVDAKKLTSFIDELKKRQIHKKYLVYGRADFIAKNPNIINDFAKVGLRTVIVGFESFSNDELDMYNKNSNVDMYKETMRVLKSAGVECFATIIIPPHWDKNDFKTMVKAVKSLGIHYVNLQPLTPLPKTGVNYPESEIIISKEEYEKWDLAHVTVRPHKLSVAEFYKEILKAYVSILYAPKVLWQHLIQHKPIMLYKMLMGGRRVMKQYKQKIKEAKKYA